MSNSFFRNLCVTAIVIGFLVPISSFAQSTSGDLTGVVSDASGAAIPNASVEATNVATGVKTNASSNANGEYHLSNLPTGNYELNVSAAGFGPRKLTDVTVDLNKIGTRNVMLQVGTASSTVEVSTSAVTIDTSTAQITNTFETKMTSDLPSATVGNGVLNLSLLSAGVVSSGGVGAGAGPSVGGQRPRNNNFTIEGIDNNSKSVTGPLVFVPNDSVSEFTVLQNQYTAEYGHSSGGQFNTTVKSGTNSFHGMLYDYLQNRNFDAIDQQVANSDIAGGVKPSNTRYDYNRLGGEVGGPIMKNKLFYFADFEYNPIGSAAVPASIFAPTAAGFSTLSSLSGISSTNLGILQKYLPAALNGTDTDPIVVNGVTYNIPIGQINVIGPSYQNNYYGVSSVDYNFSEKDQIRGRFIYNKNQGIDTAASLPTFFQALPTTYYLGTLTEFHNFNPGVINEFRLGYNRYNNSTPSGNFTFPGLDAFPNIDLDDLGLSIGPDGNAPQFTIQNTYEVTDNLSWVHNNHTFKFGFDGRKLISPQSFTQRSRGEYEYSNIGVFLTDQNPDVFGERSTGNYIYYGDNVNLYGYAQDTWKATPHLTMNLGVRYEFTSVPYAERQQAVNAIASVPGVLTFAKPAPQYLNFVPRIGIAYSPGNSGTTSIRAGFGMNYDTLYDNLGILSAPPQFQQTVDVGGTTGSNFLANGGISPKASAGTLDAADARAFTSAYVPDQKLPYSIQWNAGIQHVFANNYTFEVRYVGTRGIHLPVQVQLDRGPLVTPGNSLPLFFSQPSQATLDSLTLTQESLQSEFNNTGAILPQYLNAGFESPITSFQPWGSSTYHALETQMERRLSNGLTFRAAYTWSHAIDNSTADVFSTVLTPRRSEDGTNLNLDRSSSALDRRQRFTLALVYDVPLFAHSSNFIMKNIVGNWEIAPIYTYQTPEYYTVQSGADANFNGDAAGDRTYVNSSGVPGTGTSTTPLTNSAGDVVAFQVINPNAEYVSLPKGVLPNSGRNTLEGRPIDDLDLTLVKRFSITERLKIEFQAQMLNALNHPQFVPGYLNDIGSIGYTSGAVTNFLRPQTSLFNQPEAVFSSQPRTVQFAAKFSF